MHMADALLSPAVGGTLWTATAVLTVYSARKLKSSVDDHKVPLMGVFGAFIFAAQMINFSIPGTGSSGHLGGGMILAAMLGPPAAFLVMASILTVQALFFADGGLLALGANIFNLGFFPCFVAYPLIFRPLVGDQPTRGRIVAGSLLASVAGLELGALSVVLETVASGLSELPFSTFIYLMLPIHLAIGVVEGLVTAAVVSFVAKARPDAFRAAAMETSRIVSSRNILAFFLTAAIVTGGVLSWFASANPDGLEWSVFHATGKEEVPAPSSSVHALLTRLQERLAFLPGYEFKKTDEPSAGEGKKEEAWPSVSAGTSLSGIVGAVITLAVATLIGFTLRRIHWRR